MLLEASRTLSANARDRIGIAPAAAATALTLWCSKRARILILEVILILLDVLQVDNAIDAIAAVAYWPRQAIWRVLKVMGQRGESKRECTGEIPQRLSMRATTAVGGSL